MSALAGSSRVSPWSSNASSPAAAAAAQQQSPQGGSSSVRQSQSPNTSNSSPPANPAFNSNSPSTYPNPVSVEPAVPSEPLPIEADMNHVFSQANWSSLADFEAFASSFAVEPESQTQAHSQFGTIQYHESDPQQQTGPPVVYPPTTVGIDSFDNWPGEVNTMFEHATDQSYPQDETLYPTLEMQPTWQHFMMQMFGNSSAS